MTELLFFVPLSYIIAYLLLITICKIKEKRNTTYKANCAYSSFGNISITGETQNVTENQTLLY